MKVVYGMVWSDLFFTFEIPFNDFWPIFSLYFALLSVPTRSQALDISCRSSPQPQMDSQSCPKAVLAFLKSPSFQKRWHQESKLRGSRTENKGVFLTTGKSLNMGKHRGG